MIISNDLDDAAEKAVAVAEIYSQASKVRTSACCLFSRHFQAVTVIP